MSDLSDLITVLITTSPTATDPSDAALAQTFTSVGGFAGLLDCRLFVGADGVRPEQRDLSERYRAKLDFVDIYLTMSGSSVRRLPAWGHQANVLRMLLAHVTTPLVLFLEHDTPLLDAPIDWQGCADTIIDGELDLIRFHHESHVLPEHSHLMLPNDDLRTRRIPYLRTVQWSQRPHLARTDWYRKLIATYFAPSSRTMIEDVMAGVSTYHWRTYGEEGWARFRLALYADPEPTMQRSDHLDGRAGGEKYGMTFAYPGETPEGAPAPTLGRVFE